MSRKSRHHYATPPTPDMSVVESGLDRVELLEHLEGAGFQSVEVDGLSSDGIHVMVGGSSLRVGGDTDSWASGGEPPDTERTEDIDVNDGPTPEDERLMEKLDIGATLREFQPVLTNEDTIEQFVEDQVDAEVPEHLPDPVPRMDSTRLQMRIRIADKWKDRCPKQPDSIASRNWTRYTDGMTLSAYLSHPLVEGGRRRARKDVAHDLEHGFITLQSSAEWEAEQASVPKGWQEVES